MKRAAQLALALVALAIFAGCPSSRAPVPPPPPPPPTPAPYAQTVCARFNYAQADPGYAIQNNEWGSSADYCVGIGPGNRFAVASSSIDQGAGPWPGAYPSIYTGCAWGRLPDGCANGSALPVPAKDIAAISSDWSFTAPASAGFFDAAYDIWFNSTTAHDQQPDGLELMVMQTYSPGWTPAGEVLGFATVDGASYQVWGKRGTPNYLAYRAQSQGPRPLNLRAFFDEANARGYLDPAWYLQSVQAGFEVWRGGAGLATNSFSVTMKAAPN